ncbi:hypothetical protein COCOBI_16-2380 [Coccomyxa sp. Obi]|nr:hypothetical protein COCOBI_16-2380 [Coccomyxa sp. Obi]
MKSFPQFSDSLNKYLYTFSLLGLAFLTNATISMGDPSATAALDAYLAKQNPSSSTTLDAKRSRLTRLKKTGSENGSPLVGKRDSVPRSFGARLPLQDSSQQPQRSSLRPVSQSQRDPIDIKTAKCSSQQHTEAQPCRIRAVWPPSPLDEKDETPLLEKLHPATPRGGASAASGANKSSSQALQRLKRASSFKAGISHPTGTEPTSAGSRNSSHGPAEFLHPSHGAAEASRRAAKAHRAVHEDQPRSAPGLPPQSDATSAAVHPSIGAARRPQHGITAADKAHADNSGAAAAHAAVQPAGTAAAHASAAAVEPAAAQQTWRRAHWDTSLDADDARLLDSLIPPARPTHPTARPDPLQHRPILAGTAGQQTPRHDGNAAGQPAAGTLTGGIAQRVPQESGVRVPGRARAQGSISQTGQEEDSEVQGAVSAARVLEEVLADLRTQEASEAAASSPRSSGGGGSLGGNAADLTKAALEEASALDAVVSWYRDVQRQQIDEGLAGDPVMFPPAPRHSGGGTGISPPTGRSEAESVLSPGSSRTAAPTGTAISPPTIRRSGQSKSPVQDAPLSNLPELPRMKEKSAAVRQDPQPQPASRDEQKQVTSQTLLNKISSLAEDMPRLGDNPKHGQHPSREDRSALPAKRQAPTRELSTQSVSSAPKVSPKQLRSMSDIQASNGAAGNSHLLRDLEELRTKWRDFCEGKPPAPPQQAAAPEPLARLHASTSGTEIRQDLDTVWREDGSWAFLAACMDGGQDKASTAADRACGRSAAPDDCCAAADLGRLHRASDPAAGGLARMHRATDAAAGLQRVQEGCDAAAGSEFLAESYSVGEGSLDEACFSTAQPSAPHLDRRTEAGSDRCSFEGLSCVLDELSEADYQSPFHLPQDHHPMSECSAASLNWQHMTDCGAASQADDLFNALDTELSWDEVIEEFMQPLVSDEMSIIEEFMQPAKGAEPSHPNRDMFQYYMQRGQNVKRTAAMTAV